MTNAKGEDLDRAALRGGNWNNGTNSGAFYWNLNNAASNSNRNIGTHRTLRECNWQVFPTRTRGIDYLGYRFFGDRLLLRERTARQLKRKMGAFLGHGKSDDKVRSSVASYTGWLGWCDGQGLYDKYMRPVKEMEAKRC